METNGARIKKIWRATSFCSWVCTRQGKTEDLKAMLEAGMLVNLCDHKGNTLIMLASYNWKSWNNFYVNRF